MNDDEKVWRNDFHLRVNAHQHGQDQDQDHDQERAVMTTWNDVEQRALVRPGHCGYVRRTTLEDLKGKCALARPRPRPGTCSQDIME